MIETERKNGDLDHIDELQTALNDYNQNTSCIQKTNRLAATFFKRKNFERALFYGNASLTISNKKNPSIIIVAHALLKLGDKHQAVKAALDGLKDFPGNKELFNLALNVSFEINLSSTTLKLLKKLKRKSGKLNAKELNMMAVSYYLLGQLSEAEKAACIAENLFPDYSPTYNTLATIMRFKGDSNGALRYYAKCVELEPNSTQAIYNFVVTKKFQCSDVGLITNITERYAQEKHPNRKVHLGFSLAKISDDLKNYEAAANFNISAGKIHQKSKNYTIEKVKEPFEFVARYMPKAKLNLRYDSQDNCSYRPIFIVGMPRSGTSLLEQMVSNHSAVTGLGELPFIAENSLLFDDTSPDRIEKACRLMRQNYFSEISKLGVNSGAFTDKMPGNVLYISSILNAIPEAKIIHITRQAEPTCFSCFKKNFPAEGLGWTFDQSTILLYFELYLNHLHGLQKNFRKDVFTIKYEDLIEQPVKEMRRIMDYCDLPYEEDVAHPERNRRRILTASTDQAAQKIYKNSNQDWKKYKEYLPALFNGLEKLKANHGTPYVY